MNRDSEKIDRGFHSAEKPQPNRMEQEGREEREEQICILPDLSALPVQ
jgi:hypothetical protein